MKRGKEAMAGSGDPGWAKLAGAHTDAHRERIRCSDGCLNRLIGPAHGEIGDRWRDGESEEGEEVGDDGESGKTESSAERRTVWRSARRRRLIRGTVGRAAANQSRAGRPGAALAWRCSHRPLVGCSESGMYDGTVLKVKKKTKQQNKKRVLSATDGRHPYFFSLEQIKKESVMQ